MTFKTQWENNQIEKWSKDLWTPHQDGKYAYEKMCQIMSLGECKLKQGNTTATHVLDQPKSRILSTPNTGEDVGQQPLSLCWWENGTATLEDSSAVSYKN